MQSMYMRVLEASKVQHSRTQGASNWTVLTLVVVALTPAMHVLRRS